MKLGTRKSINKIDLARLLSECKGLGLSHFKAIEVVDAITELVSRHFYEGGDRVVIKGFGVLKKSRIPARMGYNVFEGAAQPRPEITTIKFKIGRSFFRLINGDDGHAK